MSAAVDAVAPREPAARGGRRGRLARFTVTQWFGLVVGLLLLVATLGLLFGVASLERLTERRVLVLDRLDPATIAAQRLIAGYLNEETGIRGFALSGEPVFLQPYRRGSREAAAAAGELRRLRRDTDALATVGADLVTVDRLAAAWRGGFAEPTIAAVRAGREGPPGALGKARFDALRAALEDMQRDLAAARRAARSELDSSAVFVRDVFIGAGLLVLLAVLAAALALRRVIIQPLAGLAHDVRAVARGDFAHPLEPVGPREVSELGRDVDAMRDRILAEVAALREAEQALIEQARELERSNQELEQFAYVASHDLQEPLRKVASFTQMLERRYKGQLDERADQYIAYAVDGAKRMQELINDLLEFSRVGRLTRPHQPVDTGALVAQARSRLAAALEETGGEVVVRGELPTVPGDAGLLVGVFQNLISNGLKFRADAPPRVELAAERDGPCWVFTCTDNGIGVDDQYAERIFVIFQRLHTREAYAGTGIGLALCRKIIEYHGGHIELAPCEPGRGARFVFTLPALDSRVDAAP